MGLLDQIKDQFYEEEVKYKAAVSQSTGFKLGRMLNWIGARFHLPINMPINGPYGLISSAEAVDGLYIVQFDMEIFDVGIYSCVGGSSGTTELDLLVSPNNGDSFTSIFSTTPKIDSTAIDYARIRVGEAVSGCTAPILTSNPIEVTAGSALRLDIIQTMPGAENCGLLIFYRPI